MPRRHGVRPALAVAAALAIALVSAFAGTTRMASATVAPGGIDLTHLVVSCSEVATGFSQPDGIVNAGDGSNRLFVVEQKGLVKVLRGGVVQPQPYLDLTASITASGDELGLESITFAPTFKQTGRLYAYYTTPDGYDVLERLTVGDSATDTPTIAKRTVLIKQRKYAPWHHGGGMAFGPDGYLYIGMGDGAMRGDPFKHAQNNHYLLGKILRIDPGDHPGKAPFEGTYRIPKSNPFYKVKGIRKEIWARGLRNPWRLSFDSVTGDLWIGDVGQDSREEIDFQKAGSAGGQNYGWPYWEGNRRYPPSPRTVVSKKGFTFPIATYAHPFGEAVMGGSVYRGSAYPALWGTYLYGDWVHGWIGAVRRTSPSGKKLTYPQISVVATTPASISTFGVDESRELYFADWAGGILYRVSATTR